MESEWVFFLAQRLSLSVYVHICTSYASLAKVPGLRDQIVCSFGQIAIFWPSPLLRLCIGQLARGLAGHQSGNFANGEKMGVFLVCALNSLFRQNRPSDICLGQY